MVERIVVARGLRHPWGVAFLPGGDFLVTEKDGGMQRVSTAGRLRAVAGIPADLDNRRQTPTDNSGLFGIAVHPEFARNRLLYLAYSARGDGGTTTKLLRARLTPDARGGDRLVDVRTLFEALPRRADRYHYGGGLLIVGAHLYLTVGERHFHERDNPALPVSQDPRDRRGKVFRFLLDGSAPADNPRFGAGAVPGLYALGVRAAQGLAVEPGTTRIWFTEHGPVGGDELNVLVAGANYGWPVRTAGRYRDADYRPVSPQPGAAATPAPPHRDPAYVWRDRTVAPTGLTFYTGTEFPEWRRSLLVAGLGRGHLMRFTLADGRVGAVEYLLEDAPMRLRAVAQAPDGALYVLTDEVDGKLIRLARRRE